MRDREQALERARLSIKQGVSDYLIKRRAREQALERARLNLQRAIKGDEGGVNKSYKIESVANIDKEGYTFFEEEKIRKIEEVEKLNNILQEIVGRGRIVEYPKFTSITPVQPYLRKGEFKQAIGLLAQIIKLAFEVVVLIPLYEKKSI